MSKVLRTLRRLARFSQVRQVEQWGARLFNIEGDTALRLYRQQSWAFVHYLVHSDQETVRNRFFGYLRALLRGDFEQRSDRTSRCHGARSRTTGCRRHGRIGHSL